MGKGEATRQAILDQATALAATVGLQGLSIGSLAAALPMSKSGLFAHFQSKEALQVQVLEHVRERFVDQVITPAFKKPRGEARVRALMERWLTWGGAPGGCIFLAAATEFDARSGAPREALVRSQNDWRETLAQATRAAVAAGDFRADLDVEGFVFRLFGLITGFHHYHHLLGDPKAARWAHAALDDLLAGARTRT